MPNEEMEKPFPRLPEPPLVAEQPPQEPEQGPTSASCLAEAIRSQSIHSKVVGKRSLLRSVPKGVSPQELPALLGALQTPEVDSALEQVDFVEGQKDTYYFDNKMMTRHFAELDSMLEDKDLLATIATVVRSDCKLYPRPTQFSKLEGYPFFFSIDEILGAVARMKLEEPYSDVGMVTATNGGRGLYSSTYLSKNYAQALIQQIEVEEDENP